MCQLQKTICYTRDMTYEVGVYIDLSRTKRAAPARVVQKKTSFQEATSRFYEVGTQFVFRNKKSARRIPVVFA